jgi:hypothetical protein
VLKIILLHAEATTSGEKKKLTQRHGGHGGPQRFFNKTINALYYN